MDITHVINLQWCHNKYKTIQILRLILLSCTRHRQQLLEYYTSSAGHSQSRKISDLSQTIYPFWNIILINKVTIYIYITLWQQVHTTDRFISTEFWGDYIIYIITTFLHCLYVSLFDVHILKTACSDCETEECGLELEANSSN